MSENKTTRYLKYAIGEIILVVIGILIALQINNWNESRKEVRLGKQYLTGIKNGLEKDIFLIDSLVALYSKQISLMRNINGPFVSEAFEKGKYKSLFVPTDTTHFKFLFYRGTSFRSAKGNYSSLISDGKSSLIKNRELFGVLQSIYEEQGERIESVYETMKPTEDRIHWKYPSQKRHWNYIDLVKAKDKKIFLDLANFTEIKYFYTQELFNLGIESRKAIQLINQELDK